MDDSFLLSWRSGRAPALDPQLPFGLLISTPDSGLWLATSAPDQLISMYSIATGGAA